MKPLLPLFLTCCGSLTLAPVPNTYSYSSQSVSDTPQPNATNTYVYQDAGFCSQGPQTDFLILLDLTGLDEDQDNGENGSTAIYFPYIVSALTTWLNSFPSPSPYRFSVALMALPDGGQSGLGLPWGSAGDVAQYIQTLAPNPDYETLAEPTASWDALISACQGGFLPWDADAGRNVILFTHDDGETAGTSSSGDVLEACSGIWTQYMVGNCELNPAENLYIFSDAAGYGFQNPPGTTWTSEDLGLVLSSQVMFLELNLIVDCGGGV